MASFKEIREDVIKLADAGAQAEDINEFLMGNGYTPDEFRRASENFGTFTSSVKRGGKGIASLVGDIVPAMGGYVGEKLGIAGAKEYKERQMAEAAQTQEEIAKFLPAKYESYTDVTNPLEALGYAKEAVGEAIPSMIPSVVTGGAAGVVGRGAVAAAGKVAAEQAKKKVLAAATPEELVSGLATQQVAKAGSLAATQAMARKQLGQEALGAFTGSAALNIPEAYQSIYSETGQEQLLPALASGSFNAVLDAITPLSLLRSAKGKGLTNDAIVGAWYARGAKELGKGFLTEGATESLQEMTNAAAVKFVDENKDFFTPENLTRFIDAGLKGGIGGGAIQGGFGVAFGKQAPKAAAPLPPTPGPGPLTPAQAGATPIVSEAPQTPLKTTGEAGPIAAAERDIFGGVVPGTQLEAPAETMRPILDENGKIVGYEPVAPAQAGPELTGQQLSLQPREDDLFADQPMAQPVTKEQGPLLNEQGQPIAPEPTKPVGQALLDEVNAAKQDPAASKILKANNPATAKIVSGRVQELVDSGLNEIEALEQLYQADKSGRYPAGTKALSEAQRELLETAYRRMTGRDIEDAIKERAFMGSKQGELFEGEAPAPAPTAAPVVETPVAIAPEEAWNKHKNDDHPAFTELSPEEQNLWASMVKAGRGNAVNFQDVAGAYLERNSVAPAPTFTEVPPITKGEGEKIGDKVKGKSAVEAADWIAQNGPDKFKELMVMVGARLRELKKEGFKYSFHIANATQAAKLKSAGAAGMHSFVYKAGVRDAEITILPEYADYETIIHELLHAVTTPALYYAEHGKRAKNTKLAAYAKELKEIADIAIAEMKKRVKDGTADQFLMAAYQGLSNALGSTDQARANANREIISWAMTNSEMQKFMESIPYKNGNLFSRFIQSMRKFLGLEPKTDSLLSALMRVSEGVIGVPMSDLYAVSKAAGVPMPRQGMRREASQLEPGVLPAPPVTSGVDYGVPLDLGAQYDSQVVNTPVPAPAPGPSVVPAPGQPYTLGPITKLQSAPNAGQQVKNVAQKVTNAWNDDNWWTRFRIAAVDPTASLAKTLSALPLFQNGQLRADMLVRAFNQVINLIKNGLQSGIPVINSDGTVIIEQSENNLARSQILADELDSNPIVKGSGFSGRGFVAEIARIKRGEEIMAEDARLRAKGALMLADAKAKMAQARQLRASSAPMGDIIKLINQAKALRREGSKIKDINREKQVNQARIDWANAQMQAVPEVDAVFDIWRNINRGLVDLWESAGLLNKAEADNYRQKKFYVPLYAAREDLALDQQEAYTGKGTGTKSVGTLDRLEGSDKQRNIWENMDKHYAFMLASAYQNQTRKIAVDQLQSLGAAKIATNGDDPNINLRYKDPSHPNADDNGVVHAIVDNPNDLAAFQMMHYELNPIMKGFSATTQALRATALINPMYWIKQLIRDPIHASLVAGTGIVTPWHSAKEYINVLANNSEEALLLARRGVIGQIDSTIDLADFLKQVGTEKINPSKLDKMIHAVMKAHEASDAATRVAIYKKAKAEGLAKGMSEKEATDYGVFKSRESINFAVRGNSKTLNALRHMIPFFSAAIVGLDTMYRAATGYGLNPAEKKAAQQLFIKRAAMMSLMTTAYAMMLQDDEDYKKLPDNVKDNNWLLPNPFGEGHSFIKIAVPYEVGFLFKTVPEAAVRYLAGNATGKELLASYASGLQRNLPGEGILIPQAAKPALEAVTNYSFFTKRPIEGMSDQGLPVAQRGPNASEVAKVASKYGLDKIGISPAKFDHLMQGYFAEMGTFTTGAASAAINAATGKEPPAKNIEQMPFFKSFMTNPNTSKAATDFYDIMNNAQETVNAFNRMKKEGRVEEAKEFMADEDKRKLMAIAPTMRKIQENMAKIRARVNQVEASKGMDPETKRQQINKLMEMYDKVAKQGYQITQRAGIER